MSVCVCVRVCFVDPWQRLEEMNLGHACSQLKWSGCESKAKEAVKAHLKKGADRC